MWYSKIQTSRTSEKKGVYTEDIDEGQDCFSLRWVLKEKVANDEKLLKASLCAKSFKEEQHLWTDSPVCCKKAFVLHVV